MLYSFNVRQRINNSSFPFKIDDKINISAGTSTAVQKYPGKYF